MDPFRMNNGTLGVWTGQNYQDLPTYDAADFQKQSVFKKGWNPAWGAQPEDGGWNQEGYVYDPNATGSGDSGVDRGYMEDQWALSPEARAKYGDLFGGGMGNNWEMNFGTDPNKFTAKLKSADKVGTNVEYVLKDGKYVPRITGMQTWDTNDGQQNMQLLKMAGMALGGAGLAAGVGGTLSGIASGTMPTLGGVGQTLGALNTFSGGSIPGLDKAGFLAGLGGDVSSLGNLATNGVNSLGDIAKLGQTGYNVYSKGNKVMDMFSGPDEQAGTGYAGPARPVNTTMPGGGGAASTGGGFDWGNLGNILFGGAGNGNTGVMDLYGAYKGSKEARDEAFRLQNLYNDAQARRQPVLDRLNQSYMDPNSFYDSEQWKGLSSVYKNSIDRKAAAQGRMANPTDREVLMQQHAMKGLEDYRSGLRSEVQALNPDNYINPFMRGSTREANASNPYFAMGGRGSVGGPGMQGGQQGGGIPGLIQQVAGAFGGINKIPQAILGALGMGTSSMPTSTWGAGETNPNYGSPEGGFEGDYPMSEGYPQMGIGQGEDYPPMGSFGEGGFNTGTFGGGGYGGEGFSTDPNTWAELPIEDTSWLSGMGDWFDW